MNNGVTLPEALIRQLEQAIKEVAQRSGWGNVTIEVERGKLRRIVIASSVNVKNE